MGMTRPRHRSRAIAGLAALAVALVVALPAAPADAHPGGDAPRCHRCDDIHFTWMKGFDDPATPDNLDRVGVLEIGPRTARHVLVLSPGTSAGSAYFLPLAQDIVHCTHGQWQVWSVERRENQLEDQSVADEFKAGKVDGHQLFDYYLGWLTNPAITNHFQLIPDADVAYA